jgi:predicted dehydrogenase
MKLKIALIGLGFSGTRFIRCLNYFSENNNYIEIIGISDLKKPINKLFNDYPFFSSIEELLKIDFDVLIVTTNDNTHEDIFREISKLKRNIDVISEKPLVSTLKYCDELDSFFKNRMVFVNYVERFSPIIFKLQNFLHKQNLIFKKGSFLWGKDRFLDSRKTMGIYADITHPLDLLTFILKPTNTSVKVINYTYFPITQFDVPVVDSIDVLIKLDECNIIGHSSFTWLERIRKLILYADDKNNPKIGYQIKLSFDNVLWDYDKIQIVKYNKCNYTKKIIMNTEYPNSNYISKLPELNKVYAFLSTALKCIYEKKRTQKDLCDYNQAKGNLYLLQNIMMQI